MVLFGKKRKTIDLTKDSDNSNFIPFRKDFNMVGDSVDLRGEKLQARQQVSNNQTSSLNQSNQSSEKNTGNFFDFFSNNSAQETQTQNQNFPQSNISDNENTSLKRDLRNISSRIEENSNDIYKLLHKIELLEKKIERIENK